MARRISIPLLFTCFLIAINGAQAQVWAPGPNSGGTIPELFSFTRSGQPNRIQYGGPTDAAVPLNSATPRTMVPGQPYYGADGIATTRVPVQPDWTELSPLEATLQAVFQKSYYRFEYLSWSINQPGNALLGAPLRTVFSPQDAFPVFDEQIPPNPIGNASVPTLSSIAMRDINGLRGTIGLPTSFGAVEASFFALEQGSANFNEPNLEPQREIFENGILTIEPGRFAATSLLEDGVPSDLVELYNRSFRVTYKSDILGGEANIVAANLIDFGMPGGLEIQPMFGFRYLVIQEEMQQSGQFEDITGQLPLLTSLVTSSTSNNLFGPSIGSRIEFQHERFTLGVNPKFTLATNVNRTRVNTSTFRAMDDPSTTSVDRSVNFAPITEVQTYARIRLTESIWCSVGYSLLYMTGVTRPHDNIYYNDLGQSPTPPAIAVKPKSTYMRVEGLTLGIDILLP